MSHDSPPDDTAPATPDPQAASLRADKWLWFARFFKSRGLAADVCKAGKLRVSGTKVAKASHPVRPGDVLTFPQGQEVRVVRVRALGTRRGPASEAATLYEDMDPPTSKRPASKRPTSTDPAAADPAAKPAPPPGANRPQGAGRPTKRARRELDRLRGENGT